MQKLQQMPGVKVSIVQFGCCARTVLELADAQHAAGQCLCFQSGGGTMFEPSLATALQLMRMGSQQCPGLIPVLLFMSDGCNGDGDCKQTTRSIQQEFPDLMFHAVIFGQPDSERLRGDGHFHVSADGVSLRQTFSSIATSLEYTGR